MRVHEGAPVERALEQIFRSARDLGGNERSEIADALFDFVRERRRIDDLLQRAVRACGRRFEVIEAPIAMRLRLLAFFADRGASLDELAARDGYAFRRVAGLFERIVGKQVPEPKRRTPAEALAVRWSLPDWFAERLVATQGESGAGAVAQALHGRAPLTLRVNTLKCDRDSARRRIREDHGLEVEPTPLAPHGLILGERVSIQSWPLFTEGALEVQDEGSQLIALALGARPGETVLDACAGAGGKTLALASAMEGRGRLLAIDPDEEKLGELKRRARRAGITNHEALVADLITMPKELVGRADRVLVDAPCTGSGVLRRHPLAAWELDEAKVRAFPVRQAALLERAGDAVRPGGLVLYATCSILPEENEAVVADVLAREPRYQPAPLSETLGAALAGALGATWEARIGPGPGSRDPDGFYLALLRRTR
ncbi:MAG: RsmB/NOP family class I SAM-dependent RNA methyltransferase [Deltaproteobacteria bacterium]|nr:RsmB/NOP family class I SAM-dependent RNA methyltransferase [Deltaproteobacteria bacterium]